VAQAIVDGGMEEYYSYRTQPADRARDLVPQELEGLRLYDSEALQRSFVRGDGDVREAALILEGITCAACVWLNEKHVRALPGVLAFNINYATKRARVQWDARQIQLSDILRAITSIGYQAHPFDAGRQEEAFKRERAQALRRVGVAGLGMMQAMMTAIALYSGDFYGMDEGLRQFLRWASLIITLPVIFYSSLGFFTSAWRDLKQKRLGMDLPVSITLALIFLASAWATVTNSGEVYFDTVTMFAFLLLVGRYLEMLARHKAGESAEALVKLLPNIAVRVDEDGTEHMVAVAELRPGDRVRVRPGESIPADGLVLEGHSSVDESLLTGESVPRGRGPGDAVIGGAVNVESPLLVRVEKVGEETVLSSILRLLDRAQAEKPRIGQLADRAAQWFIFGLLVVSALVAIGWWLYEPSRAFWITVSVLAVTCPCALGLATPAALTAATGRLTRLGLLVTRGHALETLAHATHVVFDKTGTLTDGQLSLERVILLGATSEDQALAWAAALERTSEHPVARAILARAGKGAAADEVSAVPGQGMEGGVDGRRFRIGVADFAMALSGQPVPMAPESAGTVVLLADTNGALAWFVLRDTPRKEAGDAVRELRELGLEVSLLSGDRPQEAERVARELGIAHAHGGLLPQDKLRHLRLLQEQGQVVVMVGDGVNDAPVLAGAQVSLAMGGGTQLAQATADMILLSENLIHIPTGVRVARRTMTIIRQNLGWALGYNLIAVPAAAAGFVPPWLAAIGMSLSSIIVVLNALRLRH